LKTFFGEEHICVIGRDNIMTMVVAKLLNEQYYDKAATGDQYARYRQYYTENNLGKQVNSLMTQQINVGISTKKIVIIDSVMNLYSTMDKIVMPQSVKNVFKIGIHCVRNKAFAGTESHVRLGTTIENQIELSGERDIFSCLPNNVIKGQHEGPSLLGLHVSLSSKRDIANIREKSIPSIVFTQVLLQDGTLFGNDYIMKFLNIIKEYYVTMETDDTTNMSLIEFLNYKLSMNSWKEIVEYLTSLSFDIRIPSQIKDKDIEKLSEGSLFLIKYRDGVCKFWNAVWARQMRGIVVRFTQGKFVLEKMCLQRGAEVLTGYLKKHDIEDTQDMNHDISMFDSTQQKVITTFMNGGKIDGAISFKVDGSLLAITLYEKDSEHAKYWTNYIETLGDDFNKVVLSKCQEMNLPFIAVMSSQGTVLIGEDMQDYTITSIFNIDSDVSEKPHEYFAKFGNLFLDKIAKLYNGFDVTLCFETVCKNRTTYLNRCHTELAVSYKKSFFRFLGMTRLDTEMFFPHYCMEEKVHKAGFEQPNYWIIKHTNQVDSIMDFLGEIINGKCSIEEFYQKNQPHNNFLNESSLDYVDIEGFVFYFHDGEKYDYSKIKTLIYYYCHKYHLANITKLLYLSFNSKIANEIFPLCRTVGIFHNELPDKLNSIGKEICKIFHNKENIDMLRSTIDLKKQLSFDRQPFESKMKILINNPSDKLMELIRPPFIEKFQLLNLDKNAKALAEFDCLIRQIIMRIAPWTDESEMSIHINNTINGKGKQKDLLESLFNTILKQ
jgi:hypothetical protein